jgi:hypothetical protein
VTSFIHFPVQNIRLTAETSAPLERTLYGLETAFIFGIYSFYLYAIVLLKIMGIYKYWYAYMRATHTSKL